MTYRAALLLLVVVALTLPKVGGDALATPLPAVLPQANLLIAGHFRINITGLDRSSSADAVTAEVDPIEIEMHDVTDSNDPTWRQFTNGVVRFGEARFTFRVSDTNFNKDLAEWQKDVTERGDAALKTISIEILDKEGRVGRQYLLLDCVPVGFAPAGSLDLVNRVCPRCPQSDNLAELTVQIGSIQIIDGTVQTGPRGHDSDSAGGKLASADQVLRYKGFDVEIKGVGNSDGSVDSSWREVRGGAVVTESLEPTVDNDGQKRFTPGKQYVSEITLTGYMTSTRPNLMKWLNASIAGDSTKLRAEVTITPKTVDGSPAPAHAYSDTMITRIQIPILSAASAEPVEEKVTLRPTRYAPK